MHDDTIRGFMNRMLLDEVVPILPLDQQDCKNFAAAVEDRFNNPFVNHELMSISLNSTSKWRARNMPSLLEYVEKNGTLPPCLTMSFAAYLAFYSNDIQALTDKAWSAGGPPATSTPSATTAGCWNFITPTGTTTSPRWSMP